MKPISKVERFFKRNSSTILTCLAAGGVIGTGVMAALDTPKAIRLLELATDEKGEPLTKTEALVAAGPAYIPTFLMGASTIICIFGANALNKRKQAALTSAYALVNGAYTEYKDKVKDLLGDSTEDNICRAIAEDKFINKPVPVSEGKMLFFEEYSGRFFESTLSEVQDAEYNFNRNYALRGYAELNEFYEFLELPVTQLGSEIGWSDGAGAAFYGYSWIDFNLEQAYMEDGTEYQIIRMPFSPTADYLDY